MSARDPSNLTCRRSFGRWRYCGRPEHQHIGLDRLCPDEPGAPPPSSRTGRPRTFLPYGSAVTRASTSMNDEEAQVLEELCKRALSGADVRAFARMHAGKVGRLQAIAASVRARVVLQIARVAERAASKGEAAE